LEGWSSATILEWFLNHELGYGCHYVDHGRMNIGDEAAPKDKVTNLPGLLDRDQQVAVGCI
jgi:hypothetical protein